MDPMKRLTKPLSAYGPALFIIGATIGTGSVSSLVVAGADHGTGLLWALVPSCFFFYVLITAVSRLTFASGQTFVSLVRQHVGPAAAFYIVLAVTVSQFSSNIGVLGIVGEAFASWIGWSPLWSTALFVTLVYFLISFGRYASFERVITGLVGLLAASFIADMFLAHPPIEEIAAGLIPSVPEGGAMVAAAMVGTTLAGSVVVMRSFIVKDKGWTLADLRHERRDAAVSGALVFLISSVVMICAAATLHVQGQRVDAAIDMAYTLIPLLGRFAATLFVVGIVAAGLSSAFPNALVSIWTISDFFGWSRDSGTWRFRLMAVFFVGAGMIAPLTGGRPVAIQIASLALQALFLPLLIFLLLLMLNRKDVVGEHANGRLMNLICGVALLFSLFMAYQAVIGIVGLVQAS